METVCTTTRDAQPDEHYDEFLCSIRTTFDDRTKYDYHLYVTDAPDLFGVFLRNLPADRRQHYTCNACRRFIDRFGALVSIDNKGASHPAMWDRYAAPAFFAEAVGAIEDMVARSPVTGVFVSNLHQWGWPMTGQWHHMHVLPRFHQVYGSKLFTPGQAAAAKKQDFETLQRALGEFPIEMVRMATALLESDSLYRSNKSLGVARWLLNLQEALAATKHDLRRDNLVWRAVASAGAGFCHVRSTMIGTLLEDLQSGMDFADVSRRFGEKMDPTRYQRPVAAPNDGQIEAAEKTIKALGVAKSLERRFAKLDDLQALWRPAPAAEPKSEGVFGHLKGVAKARFSDGIEPPPITMTWTKFRQEVLPKAERIEFLVPERNAGYAAFVTAADPDAPPILQWDLPDRRNPVSWYMYVRGSAPAAWGLMIGEYREVDAVVLSPTMWDPERTYANQTNFVMLVLKGAHDLNYSKGAGVFVETLKNELHGVRSTIEAHIKTVAIAGMSDPMACGICLERGGAWREIVRVTSQGVRLSYKLDRWD